MGKRNATTKNLAVLASKKLQGAKVYICLSNDIVLNKLFENLFYAIIKTEEFDFIKVALISSIDPDPTPIRIVKDRWTCIRFEEPVIFNVKNLVKLLCKKYMFWKS